MIGIGTVDPSLNYYSVTLTGTDDGKVHWSVISHWSGFTETKPRMELREASLVDPEKMLSNWTEVREPFAIVNTPTQLRYYIGQLGGHALVEQDLMRRHLPHMLASTASAPGAPYGGYVAEASLPKEALRRTPTPKTRMQVFKRDGLRCKVCGRRPEDHLDLELHVHHIRQWANVGLTQPWNLITICNTCHAGLDPHEDFSLYGLIGTPLVSLDSCSDHIQGVRNYRTVCTKLITALAQTSKKTRPRRRDRK